MANSKYAYVRNYEIPDPLLPGCFLICRLDGHSFHRFSDQHGFEKPNDERALKLMDHAAKDVMAAYKDIVLAFGESDEFSFLLRKSTSLYNRRHAKILSTLTSHFTASYVFHWPEYFPNTPMQYPPSFDGRVVLYPDDRSVRDYFAWRQADSESSLQPQSFRTHSVGLPGQRSAHINNLYNTVFWALVQRGGQTTTEAHAKLRGTVSSAKHEILFQQFGINYNEISLRFRKGSVIVQEVTPPDNGPGNTVFPQETPGETTMETKKRGKTKTRMEVLHCDVIGDGFWTERPYILSS
ncbi:hypothetical protein ID866_8761 [Astraeus odoratus]|nr:hypothetical protein ID866_8761 [Astraeus odoratus]